MRAVTAALLTSLLLMVLAAGCAGGEDGHPGKAVKVAGGEFQRVTPVELQTMLRSKDFPLVNVHIPYEGELASTDAFVPFDRIIGQLDELPQDKGAKVVLYCRTGRMSTEAAGALVSLGYTNIWELGGGMVEWQKAGLSLGERSR